MKKFWNIRNNAKLPEEQIAVMRGRVLMKLKRLLKSMKKIM
jgi:hypothetical protein